MKAPSLWPVAALVVFSACKEPTVQLIGAHSTTETTLELGADKILSGEFSAENQIILIRLNLNAPQMVRAELSAARGVDTSLKVLQPPDREIVSVDDSGQSAAEEIYPVYLSAGTALIRIHGKVDGTDRAKFTFFYRLFNPPADIEREPNNFFASVNRVASARVTGFYGPEYSVSEGKKTRERDCYLRDIMPSEKSALSLTLTGVDGVVGVVSLWGTDQKLLTRAEAADEGATLRISPVLIPSDGKIYACVETARPMRKVSRDYYELIFEVAAVRQTNELEPNDSQKLANPVTADRIEGMLSSVTDGDIFTYRNTRDYAIYLKAELMPEGNDGPKLTIARTGERELAFEMSAERGEVAENIRLEAGDQVYLSVMPRKGTTKKNFKPVKYVLKFKEAEARDENENEPNNIPDKADTLVDLTQKWGFINPVGDVDYYRLQLAEPAERTLILESKIACKLRAEHLRTGKSVGAQTGNAVFQYRAVFQKDDLVKLHCLGQKFAPAERAYRIAVTE